MNHYTFCPMKNSKEYKYINSGGNPLYDIPLSILRYDYLYDIAQKTNGQLKLALRNPKSNVWSKWLHFFKFESKDIIKQAYDVHRSMLDNEIVVESDYPEYIENVKASKLIGEMMESKGYQPHYYYSGSKSIHIHIFIDFEAFAKVCKHLTPKIEKYFDSIYEFFKKFIIWLREEMITCWGTNIVEFDKELIRSTHLIRAELSQNKKGFKTFLGYTYNKLSDEPFICNENSGNYPSIASTTLPIGENQFELKESEPYNFKSIIEEFLDYYDNLYRQDKIRRKSSSMGLRNTKILRSGVKLILKDSFNTTNDGMKRALFILCNELKQIYSKDEALKIAKDWNLRMGSPFREYDIEYRIRNQNKYFLKTSYINELLKEIGILV